MGQTSQDLQITLERLERLQNIRPLEICALLFWRPVRHVGPVGDVEESHSLWKGLSTGGLNRGQCFECRLHGFKGRQGNGGSNAFKKSSSRNLPGFMHIRSFLSSRYFLLPSLLAIASAGGVSP